MAERYRDRTRSFLILWKGYDHTYMTWECLDDISDEGLVRLRVL